MNKVKEFMNGLSKVNESHVLSIEEQEMVDGGACEGVSCKNSCRDSQKKTTDIGDIVISVPKKDDAEIQQP